MTSTAVKNNPMKESSNKFSTSSSGKKKAKGSVKAVKTGASKAGKNPASSSGRSGSSKSGKKKSSKTRTKESSSNRDKSKSGSKRKSGSGSSSQKRKSGGSKSKSGKGLARSETIKLSCGADVYYVSARHFAACSNLIKKELAVNAHARSVDLRQFDKTTVRVLAEYIESKKIKTDISFYSLAELLKFSKVFEMENLRAQLEKFITVIATNDLATLHQVLLIIGITAVSRPTERVILERAARNFSELAAQNTFQRIPFNIAVSLFARCDLNVKNEVQVVDAMLLWLAGQPNLPLVVPSLFYLIRHDFIHSVQKAFIIERARALRFPDDVVMAIERCFECRNGTRICVLKEHYEAKYARCGIADTSALDAKNPSMPLSLPRETILFKPTEASAAATAAADKSANRSEKSSRSKRFHSSEARPYYHGPPACSGKSKKSHGGKKSSAAGGGGSSSTRKSKSKGAGKKGRGTTATQQSSSTRSKSSGKSGSHKSNRSKKETKPAKKTPSKGKKSSSSSTRDKAAKKPPVTH